MKKVVLNSAMILIAVSMVSILGGGAFATAGSDGSQTKVRLIVGSVTTTATLNNTISAGDLMSKLPYTVKVSRSAVDYCGVLPEPLQSEDSEGQPGWKNGDISYIPGSDYIAFFFAGEADSASYGYNQHIVGKVDDIAALNAWPRGSIEVKIELLK